MAEKKTQKPETEKVAVVKGGKVYVQERPVAKDKKKK